MNSNTKKVIIGVIVIIVLGAIAWFLFGKGGNMMKGGVTVQKGDMVGVNYVGKLEDGTVFDTSFEQIAKDNALYNPQRPYAPIEFTVGSGQMIAGFDNAVVGMKEGDTKTITLPPAEAYGEVREDLVVAISGAQFTSSGITPEVGQTYQTSQGVTAVVKAVSGDTIIMDYNSPLAGKTLIFDITLVDIKNK